MKSNLDIGKEKKEAIRIALELCYDNKIVQKIDAAKSEYEIYRILKQARLDNE